MPAAIAEHCSKSVVASIRHVFTLVILLVTGVPLAAEDSVRRPAVSQASSGVTSFLAALRKEALAQGISARTFDTAFAGFAPDPKIIALTKKQSEFVKPIWSYLDDAISESRLARGRAALEQHKAAFASAERKYGVDRRVVAGIWGMETNFGSFTGSLDVIRSLATLAYARYRDDFFRKELLISLKMIEDGLAERSMMRGSWAGAMGQTQFMPSSFMKYAVDGDGDGVRDIWTSETDAIASTANYLREFGWTTGVPWGVEIALPQGFDLAAAQGAHEFSAWAKAGIKRANGAALPGKGVAELYFPAGLAGPALLITANYRVIKKYNSSDAYALGVAHLGDRLLGGSAYAKAWPRTAPRLGPGELKDLQTRLSRLGYPIGKIDGRIGEQSRESIRKHQIKLGLPPDGYPTLAFLRALRQNP